MRLDTALALLSAMICPLLLESKTTCEPAAQHDYPEGECPVNFTSEHSMRLFKVKVHVWIKAHDFCKSSSIEIQESNGKVFHSKGTLKKLHKMCGIRKLKGNNRSICDPIQQQNRKNTSLVWELVHEIQVKVRQEVSVSYIRNLKPCKVSYRVPDPVPEFELYVNLSSKSVTITTKSDREVKARWCYKRQRDCNGSNLITIDPRQSPSALLPLPYLVPCICVQVFYTHEDARRGQKCPFKNKDIIDFQGVWEPSIVTSYESRVEWSSVCPDSVMNVSASLCWKQNKHLCVTFINSTLEKTTGSPVVFNISGIDRHPQMCIQFSVQGSINVSCQFKDDKPTWEVDIGSDRQSIVVNINSSTPGKYSTQLCVLSKQECKPLGRIHSVKMEGSLAETRLNLPSHFLTQNPCVQVWQSDLRGRRIFCLDYVHYRRGLYAVAALIFVVGTTLLGLFIRNVAKSGAAGWLHFQRPLLLVCSSEDSAHVSAVCALASVLQEELGATVHTSLWAQNSQTQSKSGPSVADLGPLPWLYGQWEAVCNAQGKVFIIWSPEAKAKYEKWSEDRKRENHKKAEDELKQNGKKVGKFQKEKTQKEYVKDYEDCCPQKEQSTAIEAIFKAALACLDGTQQKCKGQEAAIVYFHGLGHRRDIPKSLRGVPRFCLPQDLRGLIRELGIVTKQSSKSGTFRWHCWPRFLNKVLSIWLARRLAQRLRMVLPRTQESTSSGKWTHKKLKRLRLPKAAMTEQEQEPLQHGSPWRMPDLTPDLTLQTFVALET